VNTFATIIEVRAFKKVRYYTVQLDGEHLSEFSKFGKEHSMDDSIKDEFNDLIQWLKIRIGDRSGAQEDFFRPERSAVALPPPVEFLKIPYKKKLRLYCLRINDHIVVLFNGGVKTARTAQDCPNVSPHFYMANRFAKGINRDIIKDIIRISPDGRYLEYADDYKLRY
jgi:hypothetical protein